MNKGYTFNDYSKEANKTIDYPEHGNNLYYPGLGLCGEAGEVAEKLKKIMRDKNGCVTMQDRVGIGKELGDVLWYLNALCQELGLSLEIIAKGNIAKLADRAKRNVIGGSGDNR